MHKPLSKMSPLEIAAFVCSELDKINIKTTLSGGFCAEIYSCGLYTSMDIDLINHYNEDHKAIVSKMRALGFSQEGKFFYHDEIAYGIEFPSGPPAVGNERIADTAQIQTEVGLLRILTPTDAVKDRLCGYFYWDQESSLEQALMIALANRVDIENLKTWAAKEGESLKFNIFNEKYLKRQKSVTQPKIPLKKLTP